MVIAVNEAAEQYLFDFEKEQPEIVAESRDELKLKLGGFAGPLDLLLFLIKQEKANIFDIPIAKITDEYLKYIRLMKSLDIAVAADFLVMAATLIEIKSKMLLPREPAQEAEEEFEDPREELIQQLVEYEKFRAAAEMLYEKSTIEQAIFTRGRIETDDNNSEINATVFDLLNVFQKVLLRFKEQVKLEIEREEISLAEMIDRVKSRLRSSGEVLLTDFFSELRSRRELVTAFIAVLEIVRTEKVSLKQNRTFGEIILRSV
ncbi:MAG TPA: segregation/condensation protein A [Pyrinomonadaceae bacterium]|nr:segregation/condensation protein A [Pyrinomonadaceae bacterium]